MYEYGNRLSIRYTGKETAYQLTMAITAADNSADPYEFTDYLDTKYHSVRGGGYRPPRVAIFKPLRVGKKSQYKAVENRQRSDRAIALPFISDKLVAKCVSSDDTFQKRGNVPMNGIDTVK